MKILVQDADGVRALEEGYASEAELQRFLMEHPDLMPLEEIRLGTPPLLPIGWEVGVVSGAEDILYIDQNGLLTVVETKLGRNSEARREVVGQILEYAAQMSAWTSADVERQAEQFFASHKGPQEYWDLTLEKALERFVQATGDVLAQAGAEAPAQLSYEAFLQAIQTNIDRGHFRLIIAIDEPPEPLLKTVEFVNRFSERFEMYLAQLKRFRDLAKKQNIFVPGLFGKVATTRSSRGRTDWDESKFFEHLTARTDAQTVEYITEAYRRFEEWTDEQLWGTGTTGSFSLVLYTGYGRVNLAGITTRGDLYVNFGSLYGKNVDDDLIRSFARRLSNVRGITLAADLHNKYPPIPKAVLRDADRREQVLSAIREVVARLKTEEPQ